MIRNIHQKELLARYHRLMIKYYEILIKHKEADADDYFDLAAAHYNLGEYGEAVKNYDILIELNPEYKEPHLYDYTLLKKIKKLKEANIKNNWKSYINKSN